MYGYAVMQSFGFTDVKHNPILDEFHMYTVPVNRVYDLF